MKISVVIPVYNAAQYVREAVESALEQSQTAEVLLIEDGSSDGTLAVCEQLARENNKVCVLRHPNGENRGASASRNLGIVTATCDYIAFLDADDYFLPGRFAAAERIFATQPDVDGVYDPMEFSFQDDAVVPRWADDGQRSGKIQMMNRDISPEKLFEAQLAGDVGAFSPIATVVKRSIFDKTGLFDVGVRREDRIWTIKAAGVARLVPGQFDTPIAIYRVHQNNQYYNPTQNRQYLARLTQTKWQILWSWSRKNLEPAKQRLLLQKLLYHQTITYVHYPPFSNRFVLALIRRLHAKWQLAQLTRRCPAVIRTGLFWRYALSLRVNAVKTVNL